MSAEILRRAASLMRERAEAATSGPWSAEDHNRDGHAPLIVGDGMAVAETFDKPHLSDAEHIASWHPAVALAVADWLDAYADRLDTLGHGIGSNMGHALAVARAYLGSDA